MARKKDLNLEQRLVLHAWMNGLFGYGSTRELLDDLKWADEGFDGEGRSGVLYRLRSRSGRLKLPLEDLERYDANVRGHLDVTITARSPSPCATSGNSPPSTPNCSWTVASPIRRPWWRT